MQTPNPRAQHPDDLRTMFVELVAAGDADGLASLYEPDAVIAFPPGRLSQGRDAIRAIWASIIDAGVPITLEPALPTVACGGIALTSTIRADGVGLRVQVVRRQADGSWQRLIDIPEMGASSPALGGEDDGR